MDSLQGISEIVLKEEVYKIEDDSGEEDFSKEHESDLFYGWEEAEESVRCTRLNLENVSRKNGFKSCTIGDILNSYETILVKEADGRAVTYTRSRKIDFKSRKKDIGCRKTDSRSKIIRERKKYTCPICSASVFDLKSHKLTHTGETPYKCTICDKEYTHRTSLLRHKICHTGVKPHECSYCEKSFVESYLLKLHTNLHFEDRRFKCHVCGKQFANKGYLRTHISTHSDEREYTCDVCKKEFKRKEHLKKHTLIHIDEKSFVCAICDKAFRTKWHLQRHMVTHEKEGSKDV